MVPRSLRHHQLRWSLRLSRQTQPSKIKAFRLPPRSAGFPSPSFSPSSLPKVIEERDPILLAAGLAWE